MKKLFSLILALCMVCMLALTANMGPTEVYMYFVKAAAEEPAA